MKYSFIYEVIADENNHGRHTILQTHFYSEAAQLVKEINTGLFSGCLMAAELKIHSFI